MYIGIALASLTKQSANVPQQPTPLSAVFQTGTEKLLRSKLEEELEARLKKAAKAAKKAGKAEKKAAKAAKKAEGAFTVPDAVLKTAEPLDSEKEAFSLMKEFSAAVNKGREVLGGGDYEEMARGVWANIMNKYVHDNGPAMVATFGTVEEAANWLLGVEKSLGLSAPTGPIGSFSISDDIKPIDSSYMSVTHGGTTQPVPQNMEGLSAESLDKLQALVKRR